MPDKHPGCVTPLAKLALSISFNHTNAISNHNNKETNSTITYYSLDVRERKGGLRGERYRVSQKRSPFLKIENISWLLSDNREGEIIENI